MVYLVLQDMILIANWLVCVGFGAQKYTHDDDKEARNLIILGTNSNGLVLGKGSIKITTNDSIAVQAKDKLKANCAIPIKSLPCLCIMMLLMRVVKVFCLLMVLNIINLKLIKMKL